MQNSFSPDEVAILAKVVDEACRRLGTTEEAAKELLAERILRYADWNERDFDTLLSAALGGADAAFAS